MTGHRRYKFIIRFYVLLVDFAVFVCGCVTCPCCDCCVISIVGCLLVSRFACLGCVRACLLTLPILLGCLLSRYLSLLGFLFWVSSLPMFCFYPSFFFVGLLIFVRLCWLNCFFCFACLSWVLYVPHSRQQRGLACFTFDRILTRIHYVEGSHNQACVSVACLGRVRT